VRRLLVRQLDVEADGEPASFLRAAICGLHHTGPAAGDDCPAQLGEAAACRARLLVYRVVFCDARRAEDGHRRLDDLVDRLEALAELVRDERDVLFEIFGLLLGGEDPYVFHQKFRGTWVACIPSILSIAGPKFSTLMNSRWW